MVGFSPAVRRWFQTRFPGPTSVQVRGWHAIAAGRHSLLAAPTGSGKTLAAFLWSIDRLYRLNRGPPQEPVERRTGRRGERANERAKSPRERPDRTGVRVVYVSPLKALAYDIERNLRAPLRGIADILRAHGGAASRDIEIDVRTGDTPQTLRRKQARRPGDILITTPESLFLVLGSAARETLRTVETIIVDEIHALVPNKRGAHLAVTLERLCALCGRDVQRIGLSATQRPIERVARYLGGDREVEIIDASAPPQLDVQIMVPVLDMEDPSAGGRASAPARPLNAADDDKADADDDDNADPGIWPHVHAELLALILGHASTIVFTNSRRLTERLADTLNEMAGADLVRAHHGSIARRRREEIEAMLASGALRGIIATSSLELGIDMGAVDLVVQIESPGSVARGLQRIGRAGHSVGHTSVGRIIPKFRGDLLEAAVVTRMMLAGDIEPIDAPRNPLDVLAQQIVAMCAMDDWPVADLARTVRRSYTFAELSDDALAGVLDMLSGRYPSDAFSGLAPRLSWDRRADVLRGRSGARMLTALNAGTIPDRGLFGVHLGPDGPRIGELDEEMVYEARPGETFLLGASTWRIAEITRDRVIVTPAPGEPGKMPFWRGEGPGRPIDLGRAIGAFVRELDTRLDDSDCADWLRRVCRMDPLAADNLLRYVADQREATGTLPTDRAITVERFRDELGDWRVCVLSPLGARVHAPWALALSHRLSQESGLAIQSAYTDDGLVLRWPAVDHCDRAGADSGGPDHAAGSATDDDLPDLAALFPDPDDVEERVTAELARSALFATHFRENAARALLLPRRRAGARTPLWSQRLRAQTLMGVAAQFPDFPIILETYRECLRDVFDMPALVGLLRDIRAGRVEIHSVETRTASPFARSLVYDYVATYLYEGDAPVAERRAHALTLNHELLRQLLGAEELRALLDPDIIAAVEAELQALAPGWRARGADEISDLLRRLGDLTGDEIAARCEPEAGDPRAMSTALSTLCDAWRAIPVHIADDRRYIAAEDAGRYRDALGCAAPPDVPEVLLGPATDPASALAGLLLRFARRRGPFVTADAAARYALPDKTIDAACRALAADGRLLRGGFRPGGDGPEWCHPEVLRALRRRTLAALRAQIAPVDDSVHGRFLPRWHAIGQRRHGLSALRDAIARLEGAPLPLSELDRAILPARVADYRPQMLDELGAAGELVWVGCGAIGKTDGRIALLSRRRAALLAPSPEPLADAALHRAIVAHLEARGASFLVELSDATGASASALADALWDLAWAGHVTNDTLSPLRALRTRDRSGRRGRRAHAAGGRWTAVSRLAGGHRVDGPGADTAAASTDDGDTMRAHAIAQALIQRYGVVSREATAAEAIPGGFTAVGKVLRAMEDAGRVRRGHFIANLTGAQFAHLDAVERLRAEREVGDHDTANGVVICLAACDPANPYGALLPWPATRLASARPSRRAGAVIVLVGGAPIVFVERGGKRLLTFDAAESPDLARALGDGLIHAARLARRRTIQIERIDGEPAIAAPWAETLGDAGFHREYKAMVRELPR